MHIGNIYMHSPLCWWYMTLFWYKLSTYWYVLVCQCTLIHFLYRSVLGTYRFRTGTYYIPYSCNAPHDSRCFLSGPGPDRAQMLRVDVPFLWQPLNNVWKQVTMIADMHQVRPPRLPWWVLILAKGFKLAVKMTFPEPNGSQRNSPLPFDSGRDTSFIPTTICIREADFDWNWNWS
jgi:hypothetical protein